jgi:maleamate amidohydrolase
MLIRGGRVVDGASYRLRVTVVEDCVFDRHAAAHAINLFDMHQKYADVLPLEAVLGRLGATPRAAPCP